MERVRRCTRRLEFDAAHRVMLHESKCKNLHGHRYVAEVTCAAPVLDSLGRVVDFSVIKQAIGGFIDERWDHGTIVNEEDLDLIELCRRNDWRLYTMKGNPTAENMAVELLEVGRKLLPEGITLVSVRLYETPNCWSEYP